MVGANVVGSVHPTASVREISREFTPSVRESAEWESAHFQSRIHSKLDGPNLHKIAHGIKQLCNPAYYAPLIFEAAA